MSLWEWSRLILAFSWRPIPFRQDNYSFQFQWCELWHFVFMFSCFFFLFCFVMSRIFFTTHLIIVTYWAEKTSRLSVLVKRSLKKTTIAEWTKTYEAMISVVTLRKINCFINPRLKFSSKMTAAWYLSGGSSRNRKLKFNWNCASNWTTINFPALEIIRYHYY